MQKNHSHVGTLLIATLCLFPVYCEAQELVTMGSAADDMIQLETQDSDQYFTTLAPGTKLNIKWDCYLANTHSITCQELANSYFIDFPYFEQKNKITQEYYLSITLRDELIKDGVKYHYTFTPGMDNNVSEILYFDPVSDSEQTDVIRERVLSNLRKLTTPYVAVIKTEKNSKGDTVVVIGDPRGQNSPPPANTSQNWYLDSDLSGRTSGQSSGARSKNGNASVAYIYANENWKFKAQARASFNKMDVPLENGQTLSVQIFEYGESVMIVRSVSKDKRWNVAVLLADNYQPTKNLKRENSATVGLEWTLVPFRTTESKTLIFRYQIGATNQIYFTPNILDRTQDRFLYHSMNIYWGWHFDKANTDVSVFAGATAPMRDHSYAGLSAGGNVKINITTSLTLRLDGMIGYLPKSLTQPKVIDYSNPIATQYVSGLSGLSYYTGITLGFTIGNSQKSFNDKRWQ